MKEGRNHQIKTALRKSEDRFRQVVEAAPNAMVMVNAAGLIEMVNAQAERVFGYARHEMLGQPVEILIPHRFHHVHPALRHMFNGDPRSRPMGGGRDLYARRKDGSEFPVEIGLNPFETDDGPMVLSAIVDISDRKQKEERIQAALREKDILLGEIHHRVKNNLQLVHSLLELQSSQIDDPTVLAMLRDSQNRIRSMVLIHQTLYQSQDFAKADFAGFLDSLLSTLVASYGMESDRIALSINTTEVQLPLSIAIPCGLVVNELITNAFKHAFPDGRAGTITVDLSDDGGLGDGGGGTIHLAVSDDGIGIGEALDMERTTTLGLQLVTLLTDQVGGTLSIQRANPTRFAMRFPAQR